MEQLIIRPGDAYKGTTFLPGGISLNREGATIPCKRKGGKIDFEEIDIPAEWANSMLKVIEQKAYQSNTAASDYFIIAPFTIWDNNLVITQEIIDTYSHEIRIIEACSVEVGMKVLPILDSKGQLVHLQKEVITVSTFGQVVFYADKHTGEVMISFELEFEVEKNFIGVHVLDIITAAKKETTTDNYRIGGTIVFPKQRRGSQMMPNVFAAIEAEFTQTTNVEEVIKIEIPNVAKAIVW